MAAASGLAVLATALREQLVAAGRWEVGRGRGSGGAEPWANIGSGKPAINRLSAG